MVRSVPPACLHYEELRLALQQGTVSVVEELIDVLHVDRLTICSIHHSFLAMTTI